MINSEYYQLKEEFLKQWPLDKIKNLTLEEYTNLDKTSFCYWVEAKTNLLGSVWGGSAYKFGIYKRSNKTKPVTISNRVTDGEYAWFSKYGETREKAFESVKNILIDIITKIQNGKIEDIAAIDLGDAYKWKIAFLYSNFNIINIFKWDSLYSAAESLGYAGEKKFANLHQFLLSKKPADLDYFDYTKSLWVHDQEEEEIEEGEKEIFDLTSLNQIFYGPPGTGKTYKINSFLNAVRSTKIVEPDVSIKVDRHKTFWHLAPGQGGYLWNDLKKGNRLGYEWCNMNLGNLKTLDKNKTENYKMRTYFADVKKGDYFCIISGKKFYGIAEAQHDYDFSRAEAANFDFQTIEVQWIKVFDTPELLSASYTPTFGKLNGGKRWNSLIQALQVNNIDFNDADLEEKKIIALPGNSFFTTFHQSYSYEDFIEGIKPELNQSDEENVDSTDIKYILQDGIFKLACDKAANLAGFEDLIDALTSSPEVIKAKFEVSEPFYLFIDEINRGNVSQIFGELITLIEKDKRLGQPNETRITLPYSKSEVQFCVPPNLYIIGTMNTADRSVEALDTALRRRFSFVEMMPDINVVKNKVFSDNFKRAEIMEKINIRIEALLDRNYTLGHSYFIKDDFKSSFKNEIIPLLQEYFYNDYGKIGLILGKGFVREKEISKTINQNSIFADFDTRNEIDIIKSYELIPFEDDKFNFDTALETLLI